MILARCSGPASEVAPRANNRAHGGCMIRHPASKIGRGTVLDAVPAARAGQGWFGYPYDSSSAPGRDGLLDNREAGGDNEHEQHHSACTQTVHSQDPAHASKHCTVAPKSRRAMAPQDGSTLSIYTCACNLKAVLCLCACFELVICSLPFHGSR